MYSPRSYFTSEPVLVTKKQRNHDKSLCLQWFLIQHDFTLCFLRIDIYLTNITHYTPQAREIPNPYYTNTAAVAAVAAAAAPDNDDYESIAAAVHMSIDDEQKEEHISSYCNITGADAESARHLLEVLLRHCVFTAPLLRYFLFVWIIIDSWQFILTCIDFHLCWVHLLEVKLISYIALLLRHILFSWIAVESADTYVSSFCIITFSSLSSSSCFRFPFFTVFLFFCSVFLIYHSH